MARIKPFKAVRPASDKVHLVASRSYVSYTKEKLKEKLDSNPYTFIHVINPDYDQESKAKGGTSEMFRKVKAKYTSFIDSEILKKDDSDSFYIYSQITTTHSYTGIIAGVSVADYENRVVRIHEATIDSREKLFTEYLNSVDFNAEPVLLSYEKNKNVEDLISTAKKSVPDNDFTTTDEVRHTLWRITDENQITELQAQFQSIPSLYIADGHHRSASSVNLSRVRNNPNPMANSNWFMAMLTQESDMKIFGFHRLIRNFSRAETDLFISQINNNFDIKPIDGDLLSPEKGEVHMYYFGTGWTKFVLKDEISNTPKDQIDAEKLSQQILAPIFKITDLKNDKRVKFIPAKDDLASLLENIDAGNEILFLLPAVSFTELKNVADANEFMPPKSTYIEPKLRSGLTIFDISDE